MKIITFNINSIRKRLDPIHSILYKYQPQILALQETKITDEIFTNLLPQFNFTPYNVIYSGQKTYNGVALLIDPQLKILNYSNVLPGFLYAEQRFLAAQLQNIQGYVFTVINVYVPQGQYIESDHYTKKLNFLRALIQYIYSLNNTPILLLGDFNICIYDSDTYSPHSFQDKNMCTPLERQAITQIKNLGFCDNLEKFMLTQTFTWWDYRHNSFKANLGLRIDHIFSNFYFNCTHSTVLKAYRGQENCSDHAPLMSELTIVKDHIP